MGAQKRSAEFTALVAMVVITAALWSFIPSVIPWHLDLLGNPDVWAPKALALGMAPFVALLFATLGRRWSTGVPARRLQVLWALLLAHLSIVSHGLGLPVLGKAFVIAIVIMLVITQLFIRAAAKPPADVV